MRETAEFIIYKLEKKIIVKLNRKTVNTSSWLRILNSPVFKNLISSE